MNGSGLSDNFYLVTNYRREKRTISYSPVEFDLSENALFEKVISKGTSSISVHGHFRQSVRFVCSMQ